MSSIYNTGFNSYQYNIYIDLDIKKHALSVKNKCTNICSSILNTVYEHSIFFALKEQNILNKRELHVNSSIKEKVTYGVKQGAQGIIIAVALSTMLSGLEGEDDSTTDSPSLKMLVGGAILEELIFRGFIQNSLSLAQKTAQLITPKVLKNNKIFKAIQSPCTRIVLTNTLFALLHLSNAQSYLSTSKAIKQVIRIALFAEESILHETTNNIIAPISSHITNNLIAGILVSI